MKRYLIEAVKCGDNSEFSEWAGTRENGIAAIKINDGSGSKWMTVFATEDSDIIALSDEDIYEIAEKNGITEEVIEAMDKHGIDSYDGIDFDRYYEDTFKEIVGKSDNPAAMVVRYLFNLVYCDPSDIDGLIMLGCGKYADEIRIPLSEEEMGYLEDMNMPVEKIRNCLEGPKFKVLKGN